MYFESKTFGIFLGTFLFDTAVNAIVNRCVALIRSLC